MLHVSSGARGSENATLIDQWAGPIWQILYLHLGTIELTHKALHTFNKMMKRRKTNKQKRISCLMPSTFSPVLTL